MKENNTDNQPSSSGNAVLDKLLKLKVPKVGNLVYYIQVKTNKGIDTYNLAYGVILEIKPIANPVNPHPLLSNQFIIRNYFSNEVGVGYYPFFSKSKVLEYLTVSTAAYNAFINH